MRKPDLRHKFAVYCLQVALIVIFLGVSGGQTHVRAQEGLSYNQPFYDYQRDLHFGFTLGLNFGSFQLQFSDEFYNNDTLLSINSTSYPGLTLGAISNWQATDRLNFRFVPRLSLSQRTLDYNFADRDLERKEIESVLLELPVKAKYQATRHANFRLYVFGGGKYAYDIASQADAVADAADPIVAIKPHHYYYEFGIGLDIYFPYFKFSPEIKFSHGINNILAEDPHVYSNALEGLIPRFVYLNFHFE